MSTVRQLSEKSVLILQLLAEGRSHGQIVDTHAEITFLDICNAAQEALALNASQSSHQDRLAAVKQRHPRAYEPWSSDEETKLSAMVGEALTAAEMAAQLGRQPSAIRSRLARMGLLEADASHARSAEPPVPETHLDLVEERLADYRRDPTRARPAFEAIDRLESEMR